jgi:hypothetical protein
MRGKIKGARKALRSRAHSDLAMKAPDRKGCRATDDFGLTQVQRSPIVKS